MRLAPGGPVESGNDDAGDADRVSGIVSQIKADLLLGHVSDLRAMVEQRLHDGTLDLSDAEVDRIVASLQA